MKKVAIIVPHHKNEFSENEMISLKQLDSILGNYPIFLVVPERLRGKISLFKWKNIFVSDCSFGSIERYNRTFLSPWLYELFDDYEYMLIYHTDSLVFSNCLIEYCSLGYDYIGAPWNKLNGTYVYNGKKYSVPVGNGGFTLRKVESCIKIITKYRDMADKWTLNEDVFFAHIGLMHAEEFRIAPISVASSFSLETNADIFLRINGGKMPFGCHKWQLYCGDYYKEIFSVIGIKLPESYEFRNDDRVFFSNYLFSKALDKLESNDILPVDTINNNLYIWGFGNNGKLIYERLLLRGIKVNGIYDRNRSGEVVGNITIGTIEQHDISKGVVLISSDKYENDMCAELETRGFCRKINYYTLADVVLSLNDISNLTDDWYYGYKVL